jgi:hypothetical protein
VLKFIAERLSDIDVHIQEVETLLLANGLGSACR